MAADNKFELLVLSPAMGASPASLELFTQIFCGKTVTDPNSSWQDQLYQHMGNAWRIWMGTALRAALESHHCSFLQDAKPMSNQTT